MNLSGASVAVVGMARSGHAAVELLLEKGARVRAVDEKPTAALAASLAALGVDLVPQSEAALSGVELIVVSPGVPADLDLLQTARANGVKVIGDLELTGWFLKGPVIGITGSNGKTTTTALTGHILQTASIDCQVGGNIGTAPASMVNTSRDGRWNVLELSSFQLETIVDFRAQTAVALNVTDNHLDRHHTFANYAAAKARLFETQQPGANAVLNAVDATCVSYAARTKGTATWFSSHTPIPNGWWLDQDGIVFQTIPVIAAREVQLRGRHNLENVMAAAATAHLAGASLTQIANGIRTFAGVEHRLEFVRNVNGVDYYNDSKATSVDATLKAIDAFAGGLWIILGGKDKNSDYTVLREPLRVKANAALLIGAALPVIEKQLHGALPLIACDTLDAAIVYARTLAKPGDTVLFAPACASFDQFENFEHRGRVFKQLVHDMGTN